ncbi:MAG: hypothetical protein GY863_23875, partial [bacterium]|nr:hypothetical protein [bacterium]
MTGKITSLIQSSAEYSILILRELISLITYINALIVGAAINFFSGMGFPGKLTPYIVPVIVQAFSKAAVKYRNRNKDFLLQLPAKREDPVFVMDKDGFVHFSIGLTEELFKRENIKNIKDFIDDKCFDSLIKLINDHGDNFGYLDVYSNLMDKWYEVKIRTTDTISDAEECIVWFTDITIRKSIESELKTEASFVNNNPAPVFRTDPDGKIISSNQAAVDIIGSESINEKIDAVIYSLSMDDFADIKAGKKT